VVLILTSASQFVLTVTIRAIINGLRFSIFDDIGAATSHNSSNTDTHFIDMANLERSSRISCVRSIVFAAYWYVPSAARKLVIHSGVRHSFDSGKNNGGVAAHVSNYVAK